MLYIIAENQLIIRHFLLSSQNPEHENIYDVILLLCCMWMLIPSFLSQ